MNTTILKYQIRLGIHIPQKENYEEIFVNLKLFDKKKFEGLIYSKTGIFHKNHCYWIIIPFEKENYLEVIDNVLDQLLKNKEKLKRIEINTDQIGFEFYFVHSGQMSWYIKHDHLLKLKQFQANPSICYNSQIEEKSNTIEIGDSEGINIYQVYFTNCKKIDVLKYKLMPLMRKYKKIARIDTFDKSKTLLILNIKDDFKNFGWNEIFNDIFIFLNKNQDFFVKNKIKAIFWEYSANASQGGEFGAEIINGIINSKVNFIFSIDKRGNPSKEIPSDIATIPLDSPLFVK
jgi:hypothetical protein